ncbi:LPS translocon maturation chaperone LptM [Zooshikella sp. RANM57]|uniref:Lipoprotein n=1 Tax=Zooshikella harenae TaxID=2827238 RepID=A0ABS5ZFF5_9GAMM|nr:lipoprotein [Zooshikella harenae]
MRIIFSMVLLLLLSGCGQKGPLYLPDDTEQQQTTEETAE